MKTTHKLLIVTSSVLLTGLIGVSSVKAFDLPDFVDDLTSYLDQGLGAVNLSDYFKLFISTINELIEPLPNAPTQGYSRIAENGLNNSYATRLDFAHSYQVQGINLQVQERNLGNNAQNLTKAALGQSNSASQNNLDLGSQSQTTDVSQHILQNISLQLGYLGTINNEIMKQNTGDREEQALNTVLTGQLAQEMAKITNLQRRELVSAQNAVNSATGLMAVPGNIIIDP